MLWYSGYKGMARLYVCVCECVRAHACVCMAWGVGGGGAKGKNIRSDASVLLYADHTRSITRGNLNKVINCTANKFRQARFLQPHYRFYMAIYGLPRNCHPELKV